MGKKDQWLEIIDKTDITRRKFIKVFGTAVATLAIPFPISEVFAATSVSIAVLATSDIHGNILDWDYLANVKPAASDGSTIGLARVSATVSHERAKYPLNLLVDNGDTIQGTPLAAYYATVNKNWTVHPMIQTFNYMKYDAIGLGNHEFNFGMDLLKNVVSHSNAPVVCANVRANGTSTPWQYLKPYTVKEFSVANVTGVAGDKIRVGIIATVTPAIPSFESPSNYQGFQFTAQEDAINQNIAILKNQQKVDAIVVLTHSGIPSSSTPYPENGVVRICNNCPGIDLLVTGHTHVRTAQNMTSFASSNVDSSVTPSATYADGVINHVPTMAPYRWGAYLAEGLLSFTKVNGKWQVQTVTTQLLSSNNVIDDPAVVAMAQPWDAATKTYLATAVGTATAAYYGTSGDKMYTPMVDLVNQAQLYYGNATVASGASFSQTALIPQGTVTLQNVSSVYIYENYLYTIQITGKQLKQYLELTACYYDQVASGVAVDPSNLANVTTRTANWPSYNYDMLTGVNYKINISKPQGSRIQNLNFSQGGASVADNAIIKLALNDYRFNGGGPLAPASVFPQANGFGGFMAAMGLDSLGRNGLAKPTVLYDSRHALGDGGQVRSLMANYITMKGSISPNTTANWTLASN